MGLIKDKNGDWKTGNILILSLITVLIFWGITFLVVHFTDNPGQIGDSFGMVNALFSALAFSLLIYTSLLQTQELKLQRDELRENRKQLESSAKAHNELVSLTKAINKDKLIPQYKLVRFQKNGNDYQFYLKVMYGETIFKKIDYIKADDKLKVFGYGRGHGSDRLKTEGEELGVFTVMNFDPEKVNKLMIYYTLGNEKPFEQEIINLKDEWRLDSPQSPYDRLAI